MRHELFDAVTERKTEARPRRSLLALSVCAHLAALAAAIVAPAMVPGALPAPMRALAWVSPVIVSLPDIPIPPEPRAHAERREAPRSGPTAPAAQPLVAATLAPVVAPQVLAPESGRVIDTGSSGEPPLTRGFIGGSGMGGFSVVEPLPAAPAPPVRLHRGIRPPVKTHDVMPEYPMAAKLSGAQGVVVIEVIIDAAGSVETAKVLRPIHPLLDRAALEAVRAWRFSPAMLNETPIPVVMTVTVHFTLQR